MCGYVPRVGQGHTRRPGRALSLGLAVLAAVAAASPGVAAEIRVDCDGGQSLAAALGQAAPGDIIVVRGTCRETVTIRTDGVTIDGGGQAVVDGVNRTRDVIAIEGARGVTLRGLTVRNGRGGLLVTNGATFVLEAATVEGSRSEGREPPGSLRRYRLTRGPDGGIYVDACWDAAGVQHEEPATHSGPGVCNTLYPSHANVRLMAGAPLASDVLKCTPKPIDSLPRDLYGRRGGAADRDLPPRCLRLLEARRQAASAQGHLALLRPGRG